MSTAALAIEMTEVTLDSKQTSNLLSNIQAVDEHYTNNISSSVKELVDGLILSLGASKVMSRQMAALSNEFEEKMKVVVARWSADRESITAESVTEKNSSSILEEIAETEMAVRHGEMSIQRMLDSSAANLGVIMRARIDHDKTKEYLKGLKFQAASK